MTLRLTRASRRIARNAWAGERRPDVLEDLPPGLRQHMPEETLVSCKVVLSPRKRARGSAVERAVIILEALAVSRDFAGDRSAGSQTQKRSRAGGHAETGSVSEHYVNPFLVCAIIAL